MNRTLLKSKIHRATVTDANLNYTGSISLGPEFLKAADLLEFEQVDIYNCNNGERFHTYVILGKPGEVCLNGAAARKVQPGDIVIIASYAEYENSEAIEHKPLLIYVDGMNEILEDQSGSS
jgi:aspartate 1-decarboxylase